MNPRGWAVGAICCLIGLPTGATTPAALYVGHSLLWRDLATGQTGELWLNADGRYAAFCDSLRGVVVHGIDGPLRWEGRQGAYQVIAAPGGVQLCLRPDDDAISRGFGIGVSLFYDAGCIVIPVHPIGEVFGLEYAHHSYTMALAQGR